MKTPDTQPQGFEPQLINIFTPNEFKTALITLERAKARNPHKKYREIIERFSKGPADIERYTNVMLTTMHMGRYGRSIEEIDGIQIWSTPDPNVNEIFLLLLAALNAVQLTKKVTPPSEADQKRLVTFFRQGVKDLPDVTEKWFGLPHKPRQLIRERLADDGAEALLKQIESRELNIRQDAEGIDLSPEAHAFKADQLRRIQTLVGRNNYAGAIDYTNQRLQRLGRFSADDNRGLSAEIYDRRGLIANELLLKGPLARLPIGNRLRSLGFLSVAADLMRAEISYGTMTSERGWLIAESYGDAGIEFVQRKVAEKALGEGTKIAYHDTGKFITTLSSVDSRDEEIVRIQRGVINVIRSL